MKLGRTIRKSWTVPLLMILVWPAGCRQHTLLEGRFLSAPGTSLSGVTVQVSLTEPESGKQNAYFVDLAADGSFSVSVRETGANLLVLADVSRRLRSPPLVMSCRDEVYAVELGQQPRVSLKHLYMLEMIRILRPKNDEVFRDPRYITLEWTEVPYASRYSLRIVDVSGSESSPSPVVDTFNLRTNRVSLQEIKDFGLVTGELSYAAAAEIGPYNRTLRSLDGGHYMLYVTAWRYDDSEKKANSLTRSAFGGHTAHRFSVEQSQEEFGHMTP